MPLTATAVELIFDLRLTQAISKRLERIYVS